jgi:hypothetical protein
MRRKNQAAKRERDVGGPPKKDDQLSADADAEGGRPPTKEHKIPKPPPINVSNVSNFYNFRGQILGIVKDNIMFKALTNNDIKITVESNDDYRNIKKHIDAMKNDTIEDNPYKNLQYHTYQLKSERLYRFVVRGLPSSTDQEEIKEAIVKLGHDVAAVTNVFKLTNNNGIKDKKSFPLFYVDIRQNPLVLSR